METRVDAVSSSRDIVPAIEPWYEVPSWEGVRFKAPWSARALILLMSSSWADLSTGQLDMMLGDVVEL
jgi:hypothetical protein